MEVNHIAGSIVRILVVLLKLQLVIEILGEVEVVPFHEFQKITGAHKVRLLSECILEIKLVNPLLVRHDDVAVVRYTPCHPVVAADGLEPPDLIFI